MNKNWLLATAVATLFAVAVSGAALAGKPPAPPGLMKKTPVKVIASLRGSGVFLYAEEANGMYTNITLTINGRSKRFGWRNVANPGYAPKLVLADLDRNGRSELVVILTTAVGPGVHITEAHIINPKTLAEIRVQDPVGVAKDKVKSKVKGGKVEVNVGGNVTVVNQTVINVTPTSWFSQVSFGNYVRFDVIGNDLVAHIGAQISPEGFVGDLQIKYQLGDGMFVAGGLTFVKR